MPKKENTNKETVPQHYYNKALIILFVIVIILIGIVLFLWYDDQAQKNSFSTSSPEPNIVTTTVEPNVMDETDNTTNNSSASDSTETKEDSTSTETQTNDKSDSTIASKYENWKSYSNQLYGYTAQYPSNWSVDPGVKESNGLVRFSNNDYPMKLENQVFYPITITYYANVNNLPYDQIFDGKNYPAMEGYTSKSDITVGGRDAIKFTGLPGLVNFTNVLIPIDRGILIIEKADHTSFLVLDKVLVGGDCHTLQDSYGANLFAAAFNGGPWGSVVDFCRMVESMENRPKMVVPLHDWHWKDEVREGFCERMPEALSPFNVEFTPLANGVSKEIKFS